MTASHVIAPPLNEVQMMLLRMFSRPVAGQDLSAIREMLLAYYEDLLQKELEMVISEKGITRSDFEKVLAQDRRTK